MKKISSFLVLLCSLSGSLFSYAQHSNDVASLDLSKMFRNSPTGDIVAAPDVKALNVFNAKFSNATRVIWSTYEKNLPFVYFETPGKTNRAGFDKNGNLVFTLSYYSEEKLPLPLLMKIKENYFGKSIFGITEVNYAGKTAYLIVLEDKTSWLHIKIIDDEMIVEHVYAKG